MNYDILSISKKIMLLNSSGKFAQNLYKEYYESKNVTMTLTNVISTLIEIITKKEFDISKNFRKLFLSETESIIIKMNFFVEIITVSNTYTGNKAILKINDNKNYLTKKESMQINDIIYHVFDDTITGDKKYCIFNI